MRCSACRMLEGDTDDGFCHAANKWFDDEWFRWYQYPELDIATDKPLNCPLVPLPEGHGRLIDAADLYAVLDGGFDVDLDELPETKAAILSMIQSAETVVPAEGGRR